MVAGGVDRAFVVRSDSRQQAATTWISQHMLRSSCVAWLEFVSAFSLPQGSITNHEAAYQRSLMTPISTTKNSRSKSISCQSIFGKEDHPLL